MFVKAPLGPKFKTGYRIQVIFVNRSYIIGSLTQDFGVADDRANLSERLLASLLHLHMGVSQHLGQLGHNAGQAGGQLFWCTKSHGTQQLHRAWRKKGGNSQESTV